MSLLEERNNTGSVETGFEQGGAGSPRSDAEIKAHDDGTGRKKKAKFLMNHFLLNTALRI